MSDDFREIKKKPHVSDILKDRRLFRLYLPVYAIFSIVILWIYPSDWLGFICVFGFGLLTFGRINKIFSGSDWGAREQNKEERDSSDGKQ
ncbi:hypothetical protein [Rhizobium sp. BR 315]|uniref:hypothetical protein n=1 Tax=Rhizobium sp. BR 315 TaxID=3040014 RepID=UPI003D328120